MLQLIQFGGWLSNILSYFISHVQLCWTSRVLSRGFKNTFATDKLSILTPRRIAQCRAQWQCNLLNLSFPRPASHDASSPSSGVDCTEKLHSTKFKLNSIKCALYLRESHQRKTIFEKTKHLLDIPILTKTC